MPLFQIPQAEEPRQIFASGPSAAYVMEPPEVAARPFVDRILWSPDGATLIVRRLVPPTGTSPLAVAAARGTEGLQGMMKLRPRMQLLAWSKSARTSRTLLDFDSVRATIGEFEPMPASDRLLVLISETPRLPDGSAAPPREAYVLVSASPGAAVRLWTASAPGEATTHIQLSPARALGAILRTGEPRTVALFGPDGRPGPELPLPAQTQFGFASDGGPGLGRRAKDKAGKWTYEFRRMDPKTGAPGAVAVEAGFERDAPSAFMPTAGVIPAVRPGTSNPKEPPMSLWHNKAPGPNAGIFLHIKDGGPDDLGLVAVDGALPLLSPKNDAVAYLSGNGAYVRSLVKVDRKAYDEAMVEAEKQRAMSTAKQVGTALAMYAADADDEFPLNNQKDSVSPYIKNPKMLDKFVYTFGGGNPSGSGNPAQTEIGYVAGPGGRAVVYADGSVKWVPDGF